ncbi:MAG: apolipoprotein N-acyltransferase [Bacteroidales bacterium]|nr:apolipoprotein N-acyltransferase [Bacteroidales bacterium]MCI1733517.1 apolipoprotein N-acyltransferase [Bacteroidales bacterium]
MLGFASALLLSIPYIIPHVGMVALVAFLPLFAAEYLATENGKKNFWIIYYCTFLIWNIITTYWIYLATLPGAIAAVTLNALQMAIIFRLFRWFRKLTSGVLPYLFFMFLWVGWEHAYYTWQISWPWLTLGNAFATSVKSIQWYSLLGTVGGSFWILLVNILLFRVLLLISAKQKITASAISVAIIILVPIVYSQIRYSSYKEKRGENITKEVAILQPNIDPYNDKFSGMSQSQQNDILFGLADKAVSDKTFLMLAPETFYTPSGPFDCLREASPEDCITYNTFRIFAMSHNVNFIFGAVTQHFYMPSVKNAIPGDLYSGSFDLSTPPTPTARPIAGGATWYDNFNTAVFVGPRGDQKDFYHKSKLVILAESVPVIKGKSVFKSLGIDLGGSIGSFGSDKERNIFCTNDDVMLGTAICYESVFGDYFREYINKGAQMMTIITNDGWWGNTFGYRQHLSYARLRAIETRRDIARCANTGVSAFINQRGDIVSSTGWWKRCYLVGNVNLNNDITIFVKYGDIIGRVSLFAFFLLLLSGIVRQITKKTIIKGVL